MLSWTTCGLHFACCTERAERRFSSMLPSLHHTLYLSIVTQQDDSIWTTECSLPENARTGLHVSLFRHKMVCNSSFSWKTERAPIPWFFPEMHTKPGLTCTINGTGNSIVSCSEQATVNPACVIMCCFPWFALAAGLELELVGMQPRHFAGLGAI